MSPSSVGAVPPTSGPATLPALLRTAAREYADLPAYSEHGITTSFGELHRRVQAAAAGYLNRGLPVGAVVGLWAPNSVDWVVAALAVSYAGGTLLPLNSRYTAHEVAKLLDRTHAHQVVIADGFLGRNQIAELQEIGTAATVVDLAAATRAQAAHPDTEARAEAVHPDDVADILFTSGTTGRPKGAMSAHRQTVGVARAWGEIGAVTRSDRYLVVNPFFHSFGYKAGIVVGLHSGACLFPMATFDVDAVLECIEGSQITVLPGAPTIFSMLLDAPDRAARDLSSLRLAVTGAAMVPVVLIERMRTDLGIDRVITAFGMTEAVVVTMCRGTEPAEVVASTNGPAISEMEIRIAGANRPGDEGELLIRGPYVMLGYLDDPEATAEAIDAEGWLHTGDVGTIDEAGNLRITDRLKDMFISGGFNVYPAEVEQALLRHPDIADVAVIGVANDRLGEVGHAYVVRRRPDLNPDDVMAFAKQRLANFKVPRSVSFLDVLPRNAMGKVLKTDLRAERNNP